MPIDVAKKAILANPTKEGTVVTQPQANGGLLSRAYSVAPSGGIDVDGLESKYTNRFDDTNYYGT